MKIGFHIDETQNILDDIRYAKDCGADAVQIFMGDKILTTLSKKLRPSSQEIRDIKTFLKKNDMKLVIHGLLRLNFCYDPEHKRNDWGITNLAYDVELAGKMGALGVVIHMGYYKTKKVDILYEECEKNFVKSIIMVLERTKKGNIILETNCNQKNSIGGTLENFIHLYHAIPLSYRKRVKLCFDSAHIFAAGYNVRNEEIMKDYWKKVDQEVGLKNVVVFHMNDAGHPLGSHVNRHAPLEKGYIYHENREALKRIVDLCRKYNITMILETPHENVKRELKLLKSFQKGGNKDYKSRILEIFETMLAFHKSLGKEGNKSTQYRISSYERAIESLKKTKHIHSIEDVKNLPFIGKSFQTKIEEIIRTGTLEQYEVIQKNTKKSMELHKIWGMGSVTISKLRKQGIHSVDELRKAVHDGKVILTEPQEISLQYYDDLNQKISRKEIEKITKSMKKMMKELPIEIYNAGSYRMGKKESGDIDMIITSEKMTSELKDNIFEVLKSSGWIIHVLSHGETRFILFIRTNETKNIVRQMDISMISNEQLPWYLLYFGSNKEFSKKIRQYAANKGYRLNEKGLFYKKTGEKVKFKPKTEEEIFDFLGIEYIEPKNRTNIRF